MKVARSIVLQARVTPDDARKIRQKAIDKKTSVSELIQQWIRRMK